MNQKKPADTKSTKRPTVNTSPPKKPPLSKSPAKLSSGKKSAEPPKPSSGKRSAEPVKRPKVELPKKPTELPKKTIEPEPKTEIRKSSMVDKKADPKPKDREVKIVDNKHDPKSDQSGKEDDQTDQDTPKRTKKQVKKLRKPKIIKKSERMARERERREKEALKANPALERERQRLQRQELNAMEKRWMFKKEAEFNKKLSELTKSNTELKALEEQLSKENEFVKNDRTYKELELEKLTQFWTITHEQLEAQKQQDVELETRMQRVKAAHVEHISLLHKRISMLQLNTRLEQISSTQTDPFGEDSDCTGYASATIQTESDFDRQKVNEVLRQHDEELGEFIAEIENAKLQAQSDYKFAVVQMEQGLREEHEEELRAIKEEKDRQLEEMVRIQCEQLQQIENDKMHQKAELSGEITNQRVELQQYMHTLEQKEAECNDLFDRLQASEKQYEGLTDKYRVLNTTYERNKISGQVLKKDAKTIDDLRNRIEKMEEINEILLGEFKKLEHERNMFSEQLTYVLKAGLGSNRSQGSGKQTPSMSVQNKAYEIGEQLDEIRRKYGGLKL